MKLSDVGERALIKIARDVCKQGGGVRVGIGDDAAVIEVGGKYIVATTDMLVAGSHFPPGTTPKQMGKKAVVVNLSDLAAMGAEPLGLIFSVALPRRLDVKFVRQLVQGMDETARKYGTYVVGGDLDESDEITIVGAAFGTTHKRKLLKRSGAKEGDLVTVTGTFGAASAGLKLLQKKLPAKGYQTLVDTILEPSARLKEGNLLARSGAVTSAIDVTDGLAANLWQLAEESRVKITVDRGKIPAHPLAKKFAVQHDFDVDDFVLFGGEDFELLFTVTPKDWRKVQHALERVGTTPTVIGRVSGGKGVFIRDKEKIRMLPNRGYEHFR
ncbi:MAG TPA: thiamine-phosphate kinase [Hadesarchaea archaeon]|nr:thiamine-phosphate kinase [Hadesarchaea archaeon]